MQALHCKERPVVVMNWLKQLPGICQILTIDQDLRPSADFGQTNLGWDPLIIGDVHPCPGMSIRWGGILMTSGLLFKPNDHVIQLPGGIPTSLKSLCPDYSSLVLFHLSAAHWARITNLSGAPEAFL